MEAKMVAVNSKDWIRNVSQRTIAKNCLKIYLQWLNVIDRTGDPFSQIKTLVIKVPSQLFQKEFLYLEESKNILRSKRGARFELY